jgi:hypothetical protein
MHIARHAHNTHTTNVCTRVDGRGHVSSAPRVRVARTRAELCLISFNMC